MNSSSDYSSLKEALADREDPDVTAYCIGQCLGLVGRDVWFGASKPLVLTPNPVSQLLYETLDRLVALKAVEYDENELRYRWNSPFELAKNLITEPGAPPNADLASPRGSSRAVEGPPSVS